MDKNNKGNGNANLYPACPGRGFAAPNVEADEVLFFILLCCKSILFDVGYLDMRKTEIEKLVANTACE